MPQEKLDLAQVYKAEYAATKKPVLLDIEPATYLAINGKGAPGDETFQDKIAALYGVAFTIKMARKLTGKGDYAIGKLEGQWWAESRHFTEVAKEQWLWRMMIRTPEFVSQEDLTQAATLLWERGKSPAVREIVLINLTEGTCVQMLHAGPYERNHETVAVMKEFAEMNGYAPHGRYHSIYISDPRRVPPEKLKTIMRQPVKKVAV
jgi:hypothetical protein